AILTGPPPDIALPSTPALTPATVAAARGRDLTTITHEALTALGGISTIIHPGESVFIKPNLLTAGLGRDNMTVTGECTKPEIIRAVAEACLQAGAAAVTIGDGAQVPTFSWEEVVTLDGTSHLAAEIARLNRLYDDRVRLVCLNSESPAFDPIPSRRTDLEQILVSSLVTRADRVISIPVLKTHRVARLSLALKNFMGTTPISDYGGGSEAIGRFRLHMAKGSFTGAFLDIAEAVRPDLAIIDASIGTEGYGPWVRPNEGRTIDMRERLGDWLVLASADPVAADATAARIVGHDPLAVDHLWKAHNQGLGQARAELITLVGATLDDLRVEWEPSPLLY
ncbi:MAG: DUF362 domain-containing protein, partial [Phycisphaerae bacterium]|nr:DUF362 domain-containing protein [Phycisphaerae bacterium]